MRSIILPHLLLHFHQAFTALSIILPHLLPRLHQAPKPTFSSVPSCRRTSLHLLISLVDCLCPYASRKTQTLPLFEDITKPSMKQLASHKLSSSLLSTDSTWL